MVLFLHEFKAWVTIDDQETEEYQFKYLPEQNVVYCWIASEVGKRFQIHWEDTKRATATDGHVVVDGNKCGGSVLSTDPDKPSCTSKSGIRTSPTTIHPFKFSQIKLTDDDTCADPKLSETELGQIDLYIFRVKIKYTEDHVGLTIPEQQSLHERAKKAIQHQTTFNDTLKSSTPKKAVRLKQLSKQPVATFRFIYRPLEMLQAKGIAPSRNEPEIKPKTETNSPESVKSEFKPAIPSQSESRTPPAPTPSATVAPTRITPASSSRDVSLPSWDTIPPPTSYAFSLLSSVVKDEEDEDDDDDEGEDVAAHHTLQVAEEEYSRKTDPEDFHIPSPALPTPKPTPTPTPAFHPKKEEGEQATERQYSLLVPGSGMSAMDAIVIDDDDDDCGEASMAYNGEVEGREILEERRDKSFSYGVSSATTTATTTTAVASAASSSDRTRDPRWRAPSTSDGVNGNNSSSTPGLEMDISTGNKRKRATSTHRSLSAAETPFGVNEKEEEEEEEYRKRIKVDNQSESLDMDVDRDVHDSFGEVEDDDDFLWMDVDVDLGMDDAEVGGAAAAPTLGVGDVEVLDVNDDDEEDKAAVREMETLRARLQLLEAQRAERKQAKGVRVQVSATQDWDVGEGDGGVAAGSGAAAVRGEALSADHNRNHWQSANTKALNDVIDLTGL